MAFREMCRAAGVYGPVINDIYHSHHIPQAKAALDGERFDWVFLDHDLDGQIGVEPGEHTGLAVAQYIAQMPPEHRPGRVVVHSYSPEGSQAMMRAFYGARYRRAEASYFGGKDFLLRVAEMAAESRAAST
jgi:hypothetical protein